MCGIAGVYIKDPSVVKYHPGFEKFADHLLLGIEGRGKHATGFVAVTFDGHVRMDKADEAASDFIKSREDIPEGVQILLLHTRYATKGNVSNHLNNHPVLHGTCFTTHNGSIENDDELFAKYGFQRSAEVDTEILPALVGHTGFDPEAIREAFKDVDGSCAMATIDPVNHPGQVLLLRTDNKSPLYIIETQKYTIWGSTQVALREAWGKAMGTPPKQVKFKYVPEWKFLILKGAADTGIQDLIPRPYKHTPYNIAGNYQKGAQVQDKKTGEWVTIAELRDREKEREENKIEETLAEHKALSAGDAGVIKADDVRDRVRELREKDLGRSTTWDKKNWIKAQVGRKWSHCNVCRQMVMDDDLQRTLTRGVMCGDCADTYNLIFSEMNTRPLVDDFDDGLVEIVKAVISPALRGKLNNWAEDEEQIHTQVMEFLAEGTGLEIPVLEYLIFRGDVDSAKTQGHLKPLVDKLWEEYNTEYCSLWEEVDPKGTDAFDSVVKAAKEAGKAISPGTSMTTRESIVLRHFSNGNATKRNSKCLFCRSRPKMRLVMADRDEPDFNYCNKHHNTCSVRGCNGDANHTRKDGLRVCHTHARGWKDCYADSVLDGMGYSLEAV